MHSRMAGTKSDGVECSLGDSSIHNVPLAFVDDGTACYRPLVSSSSPNPTFPQASPVATVSAGGGGANGFAVSPAAAQLTINSSLGEPEKRKRGRPRKYASHGSVAPGKASLSPPPSRAPPAATEMLTSPRKKPRGRPPGSGKKHQQQSVVASESAGIGFMPHVITVKAGEDVLTKLMSLSQNNRAVCILSATGVISNVTLCQTSQYGGTVTYEGRFEILSLSGSFLPSEAGGQRGRTGGLCVLLAGPDGLVLGGGVAGLLTASSPVQVIVGSFMTEGHKQLKSGQAKGSTAPLTGISGASMGGSPPSRGTLTESSGGHGSPVNQNFGTYNSTNPQSNAGVYNSSNPQPLTSVPW